ncbi:MAG: GNAT family N-acetyltransferase [Bacteroidetes bacterium]|nr:GNAT family N-acetyltransferase [Bacteroidota bacterium]
MKTEIKHYQDLSIDEFHDLIQLRISVFVVEQNCPYQELDGLDKHCFHVLVKNDDKIIATSRILPPELVSSEPAIGRVVSDPAYRNMKLGHLLMKESISFIEQTFGKVTIILSAQEHLEGFYNSHGFEATSKRYLEDGIPHVKMIKLN